MRPELSCVRYPGTLLDFKLTIADRVPHEKLPCLKPCTKVLACGHNCSGVCTDPCRCCEDCDQFKTLEAERGLAQLQLQAAPLPPSTLPTPATVPTRNSSPEEWVAFSRNPQPHDDAMRRAQLEAMGPLIELDAPSAPAAQPEKDKIKERFIPISDRDGVRVVGNQAEPRGRSLPKAYTQADNHNTGRRHRNDKQKRQGPQTQNHGSAPSKGKRSEPVLPLRKSGKGSGRANVKHGQPHGRPNLNQTRPNHRRQQQPAPPRNSPVVGAGGACQPLVNLLDTATLAGRQAPADSISLIGESDLGFEAEVLGIQRGGNRTDRGPVKKNTVDVELQEDMHTAAESLMSFGGDGTDSPTKPAPAPEDEKEEELLIDI